MTGNEESSEGKLEPLYSGSECVCPVGIVQKRGYTKAGGKLGLTSTNAAVAYNVRVGGSFYELTVSVPIGQGEGQLRCDVESAERRAKDSSLSYDVWYATRQAREWTATVKVTPTTLTVKVDPFQRLLDTVWTPPAGAVAPAFGGGGSQWAPPHSPSKPPPSAPEMSRLDRSSSNTYISGATLSGIVATAISAAVANAVATSVTSSTTGVATAGNAAITNALQLVSQAQFLALMVRHSTCAHEHV